MGALAFQEPLPRHLVDEITRLHGRGYSLLPLDGKSPIVRKGWAETRLSLGQVLGPMNSVPSLTYGVRLSGLAVVDLDEDNPSLVKEMESRFGAASVHVRSPRGRHLYYAAEKPIRANLRAEGLPVDIKSGSASYAVGPYSVRPDSGEYIPVKGQLGQALSLFEMPAVPSAAAPQVSAGNRHRELISEAIRMVEYVDGLDELAENLVFFRDTQFECPQEVSDAEVTGVAEWAWSKRLESSIYSGRNSSFKVTRSALDILKALPNASDCIALFTVLTDLHGHSYNKPFALVWRSMLDAGHIGMTEKRFRKTRDALLTSGLLIRVGNYRAGNQHQTFRLSPKGGRPSNLDMLGDFDRATSEERYD